MATCQCFSLHWTQQKGSTLLRHTLLVSLSHTCHTRETFESLLKLLILPEYMMYEPSMTGVIKLETSNILLAPGVQWPSMSTNKLHGLKICMSFCQQPVT